MDNLDAWMRAVLASRDGPMWFFVFGLLMFWIGQLCALGEHRRGDG